MAEFPTVLQNSYTECGLACVSSILRGFGHYCTIDDLHKETNVKDGINGEALCYLMQKYRLEPTPVIFKDIESLELPAILHWDSAHFVLLTKVNKNKITIMDPGAGEMTISTISAIPHLHSKFAIEVKANKDFIKKEKPESALRIRDLLSYVLSSKER